MHAVKVPPVELVFAPFQDVVISLPANSSAWSKPPAYSAKRCHIHHGGKEDRPACEIDGRRHKRLQGIVPPIGEREARQTHRPLPPVRAREGLVLAWTDQAVGKAEAGERLAIRRGRH